MSERLSVGEILDREIESRDDVSSISIRRFQHFENPPEVEVEQKIQGLGSYVVDVCEGEIIGRETYPIRTRPVMFADASPEAIQALADWETKPRYETRVAAKIPTQAWVSRP